MVYRLAASLGFSLVGIAPAAPSDHAAQFRAWLDAGKHGDMDYLARYADIALDPRHIVPGAKAIICVADRYGGAAIESGAMEPDSGGPQPARSPTGRIARYAQGDDYHRVMKNRLHQLADALREKHPDHLFRTTVDTAPVMEREHAARAGLGWVGKHTLVIHRQLGSYFLLGEIITTVPLQTSAEAGYPPPTAAPVDHCGSCTRCIDACPTQCITPYSIDASRCISYLTLEHRGEIDPALHPMMRDWLAGCDVCQEVCPFNQQAGGEAVVDRVKTDEAKDHEAKPAALSRYAPRLPSLAILEVLEWTEMDRRQALERSALKRIKLDMFKRNALIAAGNYLADCDDAPMRERIAALAADEGESPLVRQTAKQVLARAE